MRTITTTCGCMVVIIVRDCVVIIDDNTMTSSTGVPHNDIVMAGFKTPDVEVEVVD